MMINELTKGGIEMTAKTGNPAQGRQTKSRRVSKGIYERFNEILTDLVDNYRTVIVVASILVVGNMTLRNVAYLTGIIKGWW